MGLHMTMAFGDNPRVAPLKDGTVKPEGIDLEIVTIHGGMLFYRNLAYDEFDASEMSISETLLARERRETLGNGRWDWSALPVFLSRGHMWSGLYVNTSSGINSLGRPEGKAHRSPRLRHDRRPVDAVHFERPVRHRSQRQRLVQR